MTNTNLAAIVPCVSTEVDVVWLHPCVEARSDVVVGVSRWWRLCGKFRSAPATAEKSMANASTTR